MHYSAITVDASGNGSYITFRRVMDGRRPEFRMSASSLDRPIAECEIYRVEADCLFFWNIDVDLGEEEEQ